MKDFKSKSAGTWKVSLDDNGDDDLIDEDELLTEEDLKRPDPESLRGMHYKLSIM